MSFTNYLYMTSFVDVVYSTYFCTYFCSNAEIQKPILDLKRKKIKISLVVIRMLAVLQHTTYLKFLNLKHIIQFTNMILSVYPKRSLILQCKKGTKTSSWLATICSGQIIQVMQNEVVFVSFTKKLQVSVWLNH